MGRVLKIKPVLHNIIHVNDLRYDTAYKYDQYCQFGRLNTCIIGNGSSITSKVKKDDAPCTDQNKTSNTNKIRKGNRKRIHFEEDDDTVEWTEAALQKLRRLESIHINK